MSHLVDRLNEILPQTQCTECGYAGCRPYAEALSQGKEKNPTLCLPGGQFIANQIANLVGLPEQLVTRQAHSLTAYVAVDECIGCNLCMKICPVDAFIGALNYEHQVIESDCTGCQLCVPVCPTQCITMHERTERLPSQAENIAHMERKFKNEQIAKEAKMKNHKNSLEKWRLKIKKG